MTNRNYAYDYMKEVSLLVEIEGKKKDCFVVAMPKSQNGSYIALLPKEAKAFKEGKLLLFKYIEIEGEEPQIIGIEDDAEYHYADYLLEEIIGDTMYLDLIKKYEFTYI